VVRRKADDEKPAFEKTANEIVKYGFGRFTGWAHHFRKLGRCA